MAGSESAEMENLTDREIYHTQARAGNKIKCVMASLHMEIQGMDQRRAQLQRQYDDLEESLKLLQFAPLNIGKRDLPERPNNHLGLCNEIPLHTPEQAPVEMSFNVEASSEFFKNGNSHVEQWQSSIEKAIEVSPPNMLLPFRLGPQDRFDSQRMVGRDWLDLLNIGCAFPEDIEGHWRQSVQMPTDDAKEKLPWPVSCELPGYDPHDFRRRLKDLEEHSGTEKHVYRGMTAHRWHGGLLGNSEFQRGKWRWPDSYTNYIADGVLPSRAFFRYIMTEHADVWIKAPTMTPEQFVSVSSFLPSYGR